MVSVSIMKSLSASTIYSIYIIQTCLLRKDQFSAIKVYSTLWYGFGMVTCFGDGLLNYLLTFAWLGGVAWCHLVVKILTNYSSP